MRKCRGVYLRLAVIVPEQMAASKSVFETAAYG